MNLESHQSDRKIETLVRQTIVPIGFRPQSDSEIDQLLDAFGPEEVTNAKLERMLDKISGRGGSGSERPQVFFAVEFEETSESKEMAEMFRAQGDVLPADLEEQLREMERRASEPPGEDSDDE
tara:strand:- start:1085 stop:1453 length:369 start_codon:yes stop_codon:yes gene_type:complete